MADEQTDPLVALLDKSGLSTAQKRGLWDLYNAAKNTDDLVARLDALKLPTDIKRNLFDLKADEGEPVAEPVAEPQQAAEPSAGYWEDRGIAGKVWHPASGVKEGDRADVNILGVPPELAAVGALGVTRAVVQPGLTAAARALSGVKAAAGQAVPIIKYEAAQQGLKAVGIPEPLASIGAGIFAARGGKGKSPLPDETRGVLGTPKTESSLEFTRRLKAEHRATAATSAAEPVAKAPKLKSNEVLMAMKLKKAGMGDAQVMETIAKLRDMPLSWRVLPTDAEVAKLVKQANEAGRMVR